ncbi:MAG TPA: hypothetical protein PLD88_10135, partial [Candidatus Berkiella sp.]|nr:hypothetical protein [Candidatus Berkiella sp.]
YQSPKVSWNAQESFASLGKKVHLFKDTQSIIDQIIATQKPGDHVLVMSNGGFDNLHQRLLNALALETVA